MADKCNCRVAVRLLDKGTWMFRSNAMTLAQARDAASYMAKAQDTEVWIEIRDENGTWRRHD